MRVGSRREIKMLRVVKTVKRPFWVHTERPHLLYRWSWVKDHSFGGT